MRKTGFIVSVLTGLMMLSAFLHGQADQNREKRTAKWTLMVYMAADNNLESAGIEDFLEMSSVGSDDNINIVVQFDRHPGSNGWDGYTAQYGDWTTTKRFYVTKDMTPTPGNALMDLGEINMGDPDNLVDFVLWAKANYPADRYALILWDHGDGWRSPEAMAEQNALGNEIWKKVCGDESDNNDYLYMTELQSALEYCEGADLIGFDACLMGMVEVACMIDGSGSVMVGSEELTPTSGWPYHKILDDLTASPGMSPAQLGTIICDRYITVAGITGTISCIDLEPGKIENLETAVDSFSIAMMDNWNSQDKTAIMDTAKDVMAGIEEIVIHERHNYYGADSYGLAIYMPQSADLWNSAYNSDNVDLAANTQWDEFLNVFLFSMHNTWVHHIRARTKEFAGSSDDTAHRHMDLYHFCRQVVATTSIPHSPSGLTSTPLKRRRIHLKWSDNSDNELGFKIYRGTSPSNLTPVKTLNADTVEFIDRDLRSGMTYYYKVCAYTNGGERGSKTASATAMNTVRTVFDKIK